MSKVQVAVIIVFTALFLGLYFLVPNKPREQKDIDRQRAISAVSITPEKLLNSAQVTTPPAELDSIMQLETQLDSATIEQQIELLKKISSRWNLVGNFPLGGIYAEEVATLSNSDTAWSIAGSTFFSGFRFARDTSIGNYCLRKAINAFESAISINPDDTRHRVNLGLCYVEGGKAPMKGILMIRDLLQKYPNDVLVLYTLGRLSIQSGQYDKAVERLEQVVSIDDTNLNAHYLLAESYREMRNTPKAIEHYQISLNLSDDEGLNRQIENNLTELKK
ncbi:MAG: tetratricopeptide repeat protein [Bacteroidota bacterium]